MRECDLIISGGMVVTADQLDTVWRDGAVAITAGRISAVGGSAEITAGWHAPRLIDAAGAIVMPGLVNAHTHLAMTLFRGCADDVNLRAFLDRVWQLEGAHISPETIRLGTQAGVIESLRCGVTTALDMYFHHQVSADVANELGLRLITGPVLVDLPGADPGDFDRQLRGARQWLSSWRPGLAPRPAVCPHSTYTLSPAQLAATADLAGEFSAIIHTHASENTAEDETVLARHGRRPVQVLADADLLRPGTVVAHAVTVTREEMDSLAAAGAAVAHTPVSNLKLACGIAPVPELRAAGVTVALGTDGASSSNDLDLWLPIRLAPLLAKGRLADAAALPAREVIRMATIDGAKALGLDEQLGSLEPGKLADLLITAPGQAGTQPVYDPNSAIVYSLTSADIRHVITSGQLRVENGEFTAASEAEVAASLAAFATRSQPPGSG